MKSMTVFPLSIEVLALGRYSKQLKEYEVTSFISLVNSQSKDIDLSDIDGGISEKIFVEADFKKAISNNDSIFIEEFLFHENKSIFYEIIDFAISLKKEIIITSSFKKILKEINYNFTVLNKHHKIENKGYLKKLNYINVPIIMVMSEGNLTNKFDIQISLNNYFLKAGYKTSVISSKIYSELFGFNSIPNFIFDDNINNESKIYKFNRYVYDIVKNEKPDLIILGVPESIINYTRNCSSGFGIIPFIITNAITPDIMILSTYFKEIDNNYLKEMNNYCKYKYNCKIDYFNISNTFFEIEQLGSISNIVLSSINYDMIVNYIKESKVNTEKYKLFNNYSINSFNPIFNNIEEQLSNNIEILL